MTEARPPLAPGKDCFPILVNSRGFKLWRSHTRTNNLTDHITATDYKGPSFVGYIEKMEDGHDS